MFYTFLLRESVLVCHIKMPSAIRIGKAAEGVEFFSIRTYFSHHRVTGQTDGDNFHIEVYLHCHVAGGVGWMSLVEKKIWDKTSHISVRGVAANK